MAAFNFPNSPSTNDLHTENGVTYKWNGTVWKRQNTSYTDATNLNVTGISTVGSITGVAATFTGALNVNGASTFTGNSTFGGQLNIPNAIVHSGNDNLKIRFPATDTFTVETGGNERFRITSAGSVGVGTDNPTVGNSAYPVVQVHGTSLNSYFKLTNSATGVGSGDGVELSLSGSDAYLTNREAGNIIFRTSATEKVRITSAGRLGIGKGGYQGAGGISPDELLHISGDGDDAIVLEYTGSSGNHESQIQFHDFRGQTNALIANNLYNDQSGQHTASLLFKTANTGTLAERLRITSAGNIGINASAADNKIELIDDPQGFPTDSAQPLATVLLKHGTSGSNRRWIGIGASLTSAWIQSSSPGGSGLNAPLCINPGGGGIIQIHGKDLYASANADNLIIGSQTSGHTGITILCDATYDGSIHFGDGDNPNGHTRGYMRYYHSDDSLRFANNGAVEMLTIGSGTGGNYGGGYLWWNGDANTGFNDRKTYGKITLRAGRADATTVDDDSTAVKIYPAETRSSTLETKWGGIGWQHLDPENWSNYDGQQAWLGMSLNDTSGQERDRLEVHMNSGVSNDSHPNLCNLRIHPFGYVETPNQPGFLCTGRSGFSGSRDGAFATVYPSNEVYDTLGNHNLSNGTFTAPCAGRFLFYCFGLIYSMPETNFSQMKFIRNGSTYGQLVQFNGTGGNHRNFSMSIVAALSKNDTFAHQYYRTNGQSHDPYPSQWNWGGYMLG